MTVAREKLKEAIVELVDQILSQGVERISVERRGQSMVRCDVIFRRPPAQKWVDTGRQVAEGEER